MKNNYKKERLIVLIIVIAIISLTSIGYASSSVLMSLDSTLTIKGHTAAEPTGDESLLYFTSYETTLNRNQINSIDYEATVLSDGTVNIRTNIDGRIAYKNELLIKYTLVNDSDNYYTYNGATINKEVINYQSEPVPIDYPCIFGINEGDVIEPHSQKEITVLFYEEEGEIYGGEYGLTSTILFSFLDGVHEKVRPRVYTQLLENEATFDSMGTAVINVRITNQHSCGYTIMYVSDDENINISFESGIDADFIVVDKDYDEIVPFIIYTSREYQEDVTFKVIIRGGIDEFLVIREIGEVTIHPYDGNGGVPEEPTITGITATPNFEYQGWLDHIRMDLTIENQSGYDIEEWTLKVYFDPDFDLFGITNYEYIHAVDSVNAIVTIQSTGLYNANTVPIPNGTTLNINNSVIEYGKRDPDNNNLNIPLEHTRVILYAKIDGNWVYNILVG